MIENFYEDTFWGRAPVPLAVLHQTLQIKASAFDLLPQCRMHSNYKDLFCISIQNRSHIPLAVSNSTILICEWICEELYQLCIATCECVVMVMKICHCRWTKFPSIIIDGPKPWQWFVKQGPREAQRACSRQINYRRFLKIYQWLHTKLKMSHVVIYNMFLYG